MKTLKLLSLNLENFKKVKKFTFDPGGKSAEILGQNKAGKTTLQDSFSWLFFGKDSKNQAQFSVKPIDPKTKEVINGLEISVEGFFLIDGEHLQLKKVQREDWTTPRGAAEAILTGNTTDYFINKEPVQKKKYDLFINEISEEKTFRLLTDCKYFNEVLSWKDRREILINAFSTLTDKQIAESVYSSQDQEKFSIMSEILNKTTVEAHKKITATAIKEINESLKKIPVQINEVQHNLPDVSDLDKDALEKQVAFKKELLKEKQAEKLTLDSGGAIAEKTKEINEIASEIIKIKNAAASGKQAESVAANKKLNEDKMLLSATLKNLNQELADLQNEVSGVGSGIKSAKTILEINTQKRKDLLEKYHAEKDSLFNDSELVVCEECGHKNGLEAATADFNLKKSNRLADILAAGERNNKSIQELKRNIIAGQEKIEVLNGAIINKNAAIENISLKIDDIDAEIMKNIKGNDVALNPVDCKAQEDRIDALNMEISAIRNKKAVHMNTINIAITDIETDIETVQELLNDFKSVDAGKKRITELKKEQKHLVEQSSRLRQEEYLVDEFIREKIGMLEAEINSKFSLVKWKMFDLQINGGINDQLCYATIDGVPYHSLNGAATTQAGLDIINTLSPVFGLSAPVWIDNRESITDIPEMSAQTFCLVVSPKNKKLKIVKGDKNE